MCLCSVNKSKTTELKKRKRIFTAYKVVYDSCVGIESPFFSFKWQEGFWKSVSEETLVGVRPVTYDCGFHCFITKRDAKGWLKNHYGSNPFTNGCLVVRRVKVDPKTVTAVGKQQLSTYDKETDTIHTFYYDCVVARSVCMPHLNLRERLVRRLYWLLGAVTGYLDMI